MWLNDRKDKKKSTLGLSRIDVSRKSYGHFLLWFVKILFKYSGFNLLTHLKTSIANKRSHDVLSRDFTPGLQIMIIRFVIVRHRTQGAFFKIINSVKRFLTCEHPHNWTVIEIWHDEWIINDHRNFVAKNLLRRWRICSCWPAYVHTFEVCSVKFDLSSIFTPNTFILSVEDMIVFSTFITKPSTSQPWDEINNDWVIINWWYTILFCQVKKF